MARRPFSALALVVASVRRPQRWPALLLIGALLWLLAGCRAAPDTPLASPAPVTSPPPATTPAEPQPSSTAPAPTAAAPTASATPAVTPIVLAIPYGTQYFENFMRSYRQWGDRLRARSGLPLELQMSPETEMEELQMLATGELDVAGVSALAAIEGLRQGWIVPGVTTIIDGTWSAYDITFVTRRDLGLESGDSPEVLQQLNGLRPCWRSFPSYGSDTYYQLAPIGVLAQHNVTPGPAVIVTDSPDVSVFEGKCDFTILWEYEEPEDYGNRLPHPLPERGATFQEWEATMQVLTTIHDSLPLGMIVFSPTLSEADRQTLIRALLDEGGDDALVSYGRFDTALFERFTALIDASGRPISPYLTQPVYVPEEASDLPDEWVQPPPETIVLDVAMGGSNSFLPRVDNPISRVVLPAIHAGLLRRDAEGEWQPYLARTVPTLDNGGIRFVGAGDDERLEVTFELRPDLTWHDGAPLTADDLRFAWEYVMQPDYPDDHGGMAGWAAEAYVSEVEALSATRVRYRFMSAAELREAAASGGRLGTPDAYLPYVEQRGAMVPLNLLDVGRNVLPRHLLDAIPAGDLATSDFAREPVYAGPYRLVENKGPDRPVVLEAFEGFALGEPEIARVVVGAGYYSGIAEPYWQSPAQLRLALDAGAIDAQLAMPAPSAALSDWREYDDLAEEEAAQVAWQGREVAEYLLFNLDSPHTSDPLVRRAIAHALDRERLLTLALEGHGSLTTSFVSPAAPHHAAAGLATYDLDLEQARALLREAGYDVATTPATHPSRGPLRLTLAWSADELSRRGDLVAEIQSALAAIGIQVEGAESDLQSYAAEGCAGILRARAWDLTLNSLGGGSTPYSYRWADRTFRADAVPAPANECASTFTNWFGWRNERVQALLPTLGDGRLALEAPDDYRARWVELQALWAEELPALTLFFVERPVVVAHRLAGVEPGYDAFIPGGVADTWNIHEWRLTER